MSAARPSSLKLRARTDLLVHPSGRPPSVVYQQAFKEFGFLHLENHGFPEEVIKRVYQASKAFFALDEDDKLAVRADKNSRGFTAMHEETLDAAYQTKGGTKVRIWLSFCCTGRTATASVGYGRVEHDGWW